MGLLLQDIIRDFAIWVNSFFIKIQNGLYKLWRSLASFLGLVYMPMLLVLAVVALDFRSLYCFHIIYNKALKFKGDLNVKKLDASEITNNKNIGK